MCVLLCCVKNNILMNLLYNTIVVVIIKLQTENTNQVAPDEMRWDLINRPLLFHD